MDWDNLRYFLELARAGTLVGAARRLGVDHTTVARRILGLEKDMGAALFAREAGRPFARWSRLHPRRTKAWLAWCVLGRPRGLARWCWRRSWRCSPLHIPSW